MSPLPRPRTILGGTALGRWLVVFSGSTGVRTYVFDLGDRLEIEERDHWNISRRRIPFRDVVLMTRREVRQIGSLIGCLVIAAVFALIGLAIGQSIDGLAGLITFLVLGGPFLVLAGFRTLPNTELTIQSRRVTARMRYGYFRRTRTAALWSELSARVRAAQQVTADEPEQILRGDVAVGAGPTLPGDLSSQISS